MGIKDIIFTNKENIYDNFPDAVIVLDFMRNIVVWNKRAEMLFGYTKAEVKNKNVMMLFNENYERFNKIIGLNHGTILNAVSKNGEKFFVDVTAFDAYNSAKTVIAVRALSNKFLELQSLLDDYQTTKMLVSDRDSFLSNLKFDFITPLNASIGFSQSLLDGICGKTTKKQEQYLSIINSNSQKLKQLMEKTFEIISIDADNREFTLKNFDFISMISFSLEKFQNKISEKELILEQNINTEKRKAYGDEYAFVQILDILLDNAIKFTNSGKITITVSHPDIDTLESHEIKIPMGYSENSYIKIDIADTGIGVNEERLSEIFDEYSSKNLEIAQKYEGTALSLPIARKILHKLNGAIWCTLNNADNKGSIFTFVLPIEKMKFED